MTDLIPKPSIPEEAANLNELAQKFLSAGQTDRDGAFQKFFEEVGKIQASGGDFGRQVFSQAARDNQGFNLKPTTTAGVDDGHLEINYQSKLSSCTGLGDDNGLLPCVRLTGDFTPHGYTAYGKNGPRFENTA